MNSMLEKTWTKIGNVKDFLRDGGSCVLFNGKQIAIFYFEDTDKWHATDNMCPHQKDMILSRGIIGDSKGEPKVACPMHKKTFSLNSGKCLSGENYEISVYPIKIENDFVYLS